MNHPRLTVPQVKEIKTLLQQNMFRPSEIARMYNVSKWTIYNVKKGNCFKYIKAY